MSSLDRLSNTLLVTTRAINVFRTTAKNTGTVLLCSVAVGACIWIFDGVAVLLIKTLIGAFTG